MNCPMWECVSTDCTRRRWVAAMFAMTAARGQDTPVIAGKRPMILHNDRPEDLETPTRYYDSWLTPNDAFFVRQHLPRPKVNPDDHVLTVSGRVAKELRLRPA